MEKRAPSRKPLYFIATLPPYMVREEVSAMKKEIARTWGPRHALKSPPHITLIPPFRWPERDEDQLKEALYQFARHQQSFPVVLEDFGRFDKRVIYVRIRHNAALARLHYDLCAWLQKKIQLPCKDRRPFRPHMTLAHRDLTEELFPKVWEAFAERRYQAHYTASHIALLKHNGKYWEIVAEYPLG
ncbi:MAG: 2'-5' RNA ligase family protein [Deltaproteobacteria bacterium]|nr:MAG: 2'-5' RNA ligase family protein [Deltaproteobacteria bacterium]